jgi:hypothetical protein
VPKINANETLMRVQSLNSEKSKTLLVFLSSYCSANEQFLKGVHSGLKMLEKTEVSQEVEK